MPLEVIDITFAVITLSMGIMAGWWLCSRTPQRAMERSTSDEVRCAREVLDRLRSLATNVATELGEHSSRVEEINEELVSTDAQEPVKIMRVVTELVDANKSMQGRLDQVEGRLREQARLVESHAAEAMTDALTLVGNRRAFDAEIARLRDKFNQTGQPFSLAMIDLDKFKGLNDTYGHQVGDEALRQVGRVLRRTLGKSDIIARYGGEEFAILMEMDSAEGMEPKLLQICHAIAQSPVVFQGTSLQITASVGGTQYHKDQTIEELIERADLALYASKKAGRNCAHWHDGDEIHQILAAEKEITEQFLETSATVDPAQESSARNTSAKTDHKTFKSEEFTAKLLNRTAFCHNVLSRIAEWKRGGPVLSLVLAGVDGGETIIQEHGLKAYEAVNSLLTKLIVAVVRDMDLVVRYNADCIAFLLPSARAGDAVRVAQRVREAMLQLSSPIDDKQLHFTVSIGLTEAMAHDDLVTIFQRAETALEASREQGGNTIHWFDGVGYVQSESPQHAAR
jgi:diguanylate cyclase (GGDEF)-like protein